jgi:hypothetical protein
MNTAIHRDGKTDAKFRQSLGLIFLLLAQAGYGDKWRFKPFGPGAGFHQYGVEIGSTRVKGALLLGMVPPLSGQIHSCQYNYAPDAPAA